jgi:hypothetical protein
MAATFTVRVLEDGPRNAILLVNGDNGGAPTGGADLATTSLILPSNLGLVNQSTQQHAASLRVDKIEWDVQAEVQMQVNLFWDATVPVEFYSCIGRANKYFKNFGGLYQQTGIAGSTGGISINTVGTSATLNNKWTLVLYLVKNGLNPA